MHVQLSSVVRRHLSPVVVPTRKIIKMYLLRFQSFVFEHCSCGLKAGSNDICLSVIISIWLELIALAWKHRPVFDT